MSTGFLLIKGGRIIDPSNSVDMVGDLLIVNGEIRRISRMISPELGEGGIIVSALGMVVTPGFIDLHVHLREPGMEEKETIATGTRAAARGGFSTVCCMPNTLPPIDSAQTVEFVKSRARSDAVVRVFPIGSITRGQKGEVLVDVGDLARAGVVALSEDGGSVADADLMRQALGWSGLIGLPITDHCEDADLTGGGVMNEGVVSASLGLKGMPAAAEEAIVARDIGIAAATGARIHIAHVSTASSVEIIRRARAEGVKVTAEVTPHHLTLTEERVDGVDTSTKVNPPLRTGKDTEALLRGLKEGVIDAVATDHAPHSVADKGCGFEAAAFGISGLETALGVLLGLVYERKLRLVTLISKLTAGPAGVFPALNGLGTLNAGAPADVTIFDPNMEWMVRPDEFASKGKNTPWAGHRLKGRVMATIVGGRIVYRDDALRVEEAGAEHV